jgi:hypothetical protein
MSGSDPVPDGSESGLLPEATFRAFAAALAPLTEQVGSLTKRLEDQETAIANLSSGSLPSRSEVEDARDTDPAFRSKPLKSDKRSVTIAPDKKSDGYDYPSTDEEDSSVEDARRRKSRRKKSKRYAYQYESDSSHDSIEDSTREEDYLSPLTGNFKPRGEAVSRKPGLFRLGKAIVLYDKIVESNKRDAEEYERLYCAESYWHEVEQTVGYLLQTLQASSDIAPEDKILASQSYNSLKALRDVYAVRATYLESKATKGAGYSDIVEGEEKRFEYGEYTSHRVGRLFKRIDDQRKVYQYRELAKRPAGSRLGNNPKVDNGGADTPRDKVRKPRAGKGNKTRERSREAPKSSRASESGRDRPRERERSATPGPSSRAASRSASPKPQPSKGGKGKEPAKAPKGGSKG